MSIKSYIFSENAAKEAAKECEICKAIFGLRKWKHSCKNCAQIICSGCSVHKLWSKGGEEDQLILQRICKKCLIEPELEAALPVFRDSVHSEDKTLDDVTADDEYDGYESIEEKPKRCCGCC
jgi:hypothetical protein